MADTPTIKTVTLAPAEQMREAAAQLADLLSGSLMDQHTEAKEYGIFGHGYLRSASDDVLRLAAAIRALPLPPDDLADKVKEGRDNG